MRLDGPGGHVQSICYDIYYHLVGINCRQILTGTLERER